MKSAIIVTVVLATVAFAAGSEDNSPCYGVKDGIFINNPESCHAFFFCSGGTATPGSCTEEFYFNFLAQICDWPKNVDCKTTTQAPESTTLGVSESTTTEEPTEMTTSEEPTESTITEEPTESTTTEESSDPTTTVTNTPDRTTNDVITESTIEATTGSPSVCYGRRNDVLVGSVDACDAFFHCVDNLAFQNTCPQGLSFNGLYCDFEDRVDCGRETTTTQVTEITTSTDITTPAAPEGPVDPDTVCIGRDDGTFINNPKTCPAFFYCHSEIGLSGSCPEPFYFNPKIGICDWSSNVDCSDDERTEGTTILEPTGTTATTQEPSTELPETEEPDTEAPETDEPTTEAPETEKPTTEAPATEEPTTEAPETEKPTTEAPATEEFTTGSTEDSTNCVTEVPSVCGEGEVGLHPHSSSCSLYVLCLNGQAYELSCNADEHFSIAKRACAPRDIANCRIEDPVCDPIESANSPINFPHPHFCNQFFFCFRGELVSLACSDGDHWDAEQGWCVNASTSSCVA